MFRWLRRDPKHLIERRHLMSGEFADYPIYDPPHHQSPVFPRRVQDQRQEEHNLLFREFVERGHENLRYLIEHRAARIAALSAFLAKFGVQVVCNDIGLAEVSAWCPGNCGALAVNFRDNATRQMFFQMRQPWTNEWRGFNVIFDLGIFLGECLIAKSPYLHWTYKPGLSDDGMSILSGYAIDGLKEKGTGFDPMGVIYRMCGDGEVHLRTRNNLFALNSDLLLGVVRDFSTR